MTHHSVLALVQSVVIVFGSVAAAVCFKVMKDVLGEGAAGLGLMKFLAYYGVTLFLVPLLWLACTEFCNRKLSLDRFYSWLMVTGWLLVPVLILVFVRSWPHLDIGLMP